MINMHKVLDSEAHKLRHGAAHTCLAVRCADPDVCPQQLPPHACHCIALSCMCCVVLRCAVLW
jgi:hypothetical protein